MRWIQVTAKLESSRKPKLNKHLFFSSCLFELKPRFHKMKYIVMAVEK